MFLYQFQERKKSSLKTKNNFKKIKPESLHIDPETSIFPKKKIDLIMIKTGSKIFHHN